MKHAGRWMCVVIIAILLAVAGRTAPMAGATAGLNLLANGNFEAGFAPQAGIGGQVALSWTAYARPGDTPTFGSGPGRSGSGQAIASGTSYRAGLSQTLDGLTPGQAYQAGFAARLPEPAGAITPLIGISPLGDTDPFGGIIAWSNAHHIEGQWMQMFITFTAQTTSATVFLQVEGTGGEAQPPAVIDDAYLRPVQSPIVLLPLIVRSHPLPTPTPIPSATPMPISTPMPSATLSPTPTRPSAAGPIPYWDERLNALNVTVEQDPTQRYQLIAAFITINGSWEDVPEWARVYAVPSFPERGGDHHVFGRCLDKDGNVLTGKMFVLSWPDGAGNAAPEASGWANLPIYGGAYYPDQGQSGPYRWNPLNGNQLKGIGMPYKHHYSFFGVWQEQGGGTATPTWTPSPSPSPTLSPTGAPPSPTNTPALTPTPSATPEGTSPWRFRTEGIIVGYPDCAQTRLEGTIRDLAGAPMAGVRVKAWAPEWGEAVSAPTGADGHWSLPIAGTPLNAHWQAAVVDEAGHIISPIAGLKYVPDLGGEVDGIPTSSDCSNGHQRLVINWREHTDWPQYVAASARFLSCEENHNRHNIYIWVLDREGAGINGISLRLSLPEGSYTDQPTGRDPYKPAGYLDFPMFARETRSARVRDFTSDVVAGLSNTSPPVIDACSGNAWGQYSYQVVFQATQPASALERFLARFRRKAIQLPRHP